MKSVPILDILQVNGILILKNLFLQKKNGIHIIDLIQTKKYLINATKELSKIINQGGTILFVGTKKQAKNVIQEAADKSAIHLKMQ